MGEIPLSLLQEEETVGELPEQLVLASDGIFDACNRVADPPHRTMLGHFCTGFVSRNEADVRLPELSLLWGMGPNHQIS